MTDSFQSTAFNSSRTPVSTFVSPVRVQPKTNLMALAETMAEINPTLQKFVGSQIEKAKQEGIQEGQNLVLGSDPEGIDKLRKELEKKEGKRFARNFVGGNIYTQYGIEKQLAINLGNASEAKTKKFFDEYVVDVELPNGQTIQKPLSQFDTNSNEFQQAVNEFQETSLMNTRGIRPEIVNQFLLPKQNLALQKVYKTQQENLADAKIKQANLLFNNSILNSWFSIDNINDNIENNLIEDNKSKNGLSTAEVLSLNELQDNINYMVKIGLSSSVSPSKIIDVMKTNILQIFDYYENNNLDMEVAEEEIQEYINWIGNLKVTNNQPLRNFYIQDGEDKIETFMSDINKKKANAIKNQNAFQRQKDQENISNTLNNINFSFTNFENQDGSFNIKKATMYYKQVGNLLEGLANEYPEEIDFLYKQYDLRNFSVDNFFFDLEQRYDQGEITQIEGLNQLNDVMLALGPNASKEDRAKYTKLKEYLGETEGKSLDTRFPEVANLKKYGLKTVGKTNDYGVSFIGDQPTVDKMEDLNLELNRLVKQYGGLTGTFTTDDDKNMTVRNWYLGEIRKIKNPKVFGQYEFYDSALDFTQPVPVIQEKTNDSGDGKGRTVNLDQQKVLIYDKQTKLFNEVDPSKFKTNANTIVVSMNGGLTQDGLELKDELNIDSFENFNYKLYNQNFENKETIDKNKKLLTDDLEGGAVTEVSDEEAKEIIEREDAQEKALELYESKSKTYIVKSGDNLSVIAKEFNITVDQLKEDNNLKSDLIQPNQKLKIRYNPINDKFDFKSTEILPFTDHGGLASIIRDGESSNRYNVVNYGTTDSAKVIPNLESMTINQIMEMQKNDGVFAVGAYQFTPEPLKEALTRAGLNGDVKFSKDVQDRLFWARIANTLLRSDISDYLMGISNDLDAALDSLADEFAAAPNSLGKGVHDNDEGRNKANIDLTKLKTALQNARKELLKI